jgi:hypothetical protein
MVLPLVPDQRARWDAWMEELRGARRADYVASRQEVGVRERTFLQGTPMGDLVIVTLEGDDPMASFGKLLSKNDEFTKWFVENASAAHGIDLSQPMPEAPSTLLIDSADGA